MGLAERADLVARLTLEDKFTGTLKKIEGNLGSIDTRVGRVAKSTGFLGRTFSTAFGVALDRVVSSGIDKFFGAIRGGNASLQELEAVGLRTNAVIKSTGGVADVSADQIRDLAESFEDLSTFDDKAIQNAENLLLTFTNIRKEGFEPTLQAVLDMNAALGGGDEGLAGTALKVGKALQDPILGLTALRKAGVIFSDQQEKQIRTLVKEGKLFEAQGVILAELNKEFGGQAGAFGQGRAADVRRLDDAIEDFQRTLAEGLAPATDAARKGITQLLRDPEVLQGVKDLSSGIASLFTPGNIKGGLDAVRGVIQTVRDFAPVIKDAAVVSGQVLRTAVGLFTSLPKPLQTAAIVALTANKLTGGLVGTVAKGFLEIALSQLRTITAANVTVVGANVTSVGGGVPAPVAGAGVSAAAGAAGLGGAAIVGGVAAGAAAASVGLLALGEIVKATSTEEQLVISRENFLNQTALKHGFDRQAALSAAQTTQLVQQQFDSRMIAAAQARAAGEQAQRLGGIRDAVDRQRLSVTVNTNASIVVSASAVQNKVKVHNTWSSGRALNRFGVD